MLLERLTARPRATCRMTYITPWSAIRVVNIYLVVYSVCQTWTLAQDLMCCSHTTGSCRSVCERVSLVQLASNSTLRAQTVQQLEVYCSPQLVQFWECLNATFRDISRGESYPGRICCPLPTNPACRRACITASSPFDLTPSCRQSDEIAFFTCLDRQQEGEACCGQAKTRDCSAACWVIFRSHLTPTKTQRQSVREKCEITSPNVNDCVKGFVKVTPVDNMDQHMRCCDMSNNSKCRDTCKKVLTTKTTFQEIIDGLEIGGCGAPLLQDVFWQCFLKPTQTVHSTSAEVSRIDRMGMDSAKWHCCQKASSSQCQNLCSKTFTKFLATSWVEFQDKCLHQVSEENLRNCIDEVDEPCELGCDGLSFCTNFNNRPTELFRSCTPQADEAARNEVTLWQNQNKLYLPDITLPLKNITKCSPNIWKAVACTLQIQPCSRFSHANQICKYVCVDILSNCVEWSAVQPGQTVESICSSLSSDDPNVSCIHLEQFLSPSESSYEKNSIQISSPCKGSPCRDDEICLINKNCIDGINCSRYKCVSGCKLGEVSEYMVPDGTYVRIPITNHNVRGCLKICQCRRGRIEDCQPLPCVTLISCLLGNTYQLHGSKFEIDCNTCSCFAGETICSKKQCETTALSGKNTQYTTLPCNCLPHFVPVCGRNGKTYPSACLAKCAGLTDSYFENLPCQDPCKPNPCQIGSKCVPNPQVCLSLLHKPCTQYQCVNGTTSCEKLPIDPVCDTENQEHSNSCYLAHQNSKFAYKGSCLKNCKHKGHVCGINGQTYISECAAIADMVQVDYEGVCRDIGLITNKKSFPCSHVKCTNIIDKNCLGITPPGACCPICGGALRLLFSTKQIDRALYALQNRSTTPLNLNSMLKALDRQIQVAQCTLSGYLSVESDIFVIVQTSEKSPSAIQTEACVREAEKIANLINLQSPRIVSDLSLSSLTAATVVHTPLNSGGILHKVSLYDRSRCSDDSYSCKGSRIWNKGVLIIILLLVSSSHNVF